MNSSKKKASGRKQLPVKIISEIISRVPIKSLCRFRCVSKSWNSLITSTSFALLRFNSASHKPQLNAHKLLVSKGSQLFSFDYQSSSFGTGNLVSLDFPFKTPNCTPHFVGSCNGLVCLAFNGYNDLIVWNPSTGCYRKLPDPCIPWISILYTYGFGYDPLSDDYKVLVVAEKEVKIKTWSSYSRFCVIFSLKMNSWKIIRHGSDVCDDSIVTWSTHNIWRRGVLYDDALHWNLHESILAFHLSKETFYSVEWMDYDDDCNYCNLGVLGDSLSVSCSNGDDDHYSASDFWIMENYGDTNDDEEPIWTKLVSVTDYGDFDAGCYMVPLCISNGGEIISINLGQELLRCNIRKETVERLTIGDVQHECEAMVYEENLISPTDWNQQV